MKEKLSNMSHDTEKTAEDSATEKANLEKERKKKEAEEAAAKITLELDKKYAVVTPVIPAPITATLIRN